MALERKFIAGAYSVTWNSLVMGYTEAGFEFVIETADPVPLVEDRHGASIVDAAWQKITRMVVRMSTLYWDDDAWTAALPYLASKADGQETVTAGTLLVQGGLAKVLVLTPKTGSALEAGVGNTWTFLLSYPVEPVSLSFSAKELRRIPAAFQIFPTIASDAVEADWFTSAPQA